MITRDQAEAAHAAAIEEDRSKAKDKAKAKAHEEALRAARDAAVQAIEDRRNLELHLAAVASMGEERAREKWLISRMRSHAHESKELAVWAYNRWMDRAGKICPRASALGAYRDTYQRIYDKTLAPLMDEIEANGAAMAAAITYHDQESKC